jgi:hypothetical protein
MEMDREPRSLVEMKIIAEDVREYSTAYISDEWADDLAAGILSHPYVESVFTSSEGAVLYFRVRVSGPEHWEKYIDPHCHEILRAAIEFQK